MKRAAGISAVLAAFAAGATAAQTGPSFDCMKAASAVEKAICADAEASVADRKMADAYRRLLATLAAPRAKSHLQRDQTAWLADLPQICAAPGTTRSGRDLPVCLRDLAVLRAERLATMPTGNEYVFVGERRLIERGRRGGVPYGIAVSYAVFEFHEIDYVQANGAMRAWVDKYAAHARPPTSGASGAPDVGWILESGHVVHAASRELVTVAAHWLIYSGGAHPNNGRTAWHVEVTTGRLLGLDDILVRGSGWQDSVTRLVRADLKKQFEERPGSDGSLEPAELRKMVVESHRWIFGKDKVTLTFDPYAVGPYASGPYEVELSYAALAPYIRKDGPLGNRKR